MIKLYYLWDKRNNVKIDNCFCLSFLFNIPVCMVVTSSCSSQTAGPGAGWKHNDITFPVEPQSYDPFCHCTLVWEWGGMYTCYTQLPQDCYQKAGLILLMPLWHMWKTHSGKVNSDSGSTAWRGTYCPYMWVEVCIRRSRAPILDATHPYPW